MALSYCIACDVDHVPGEHTAFPTTQQARPQRGGRHLAPKPSKQPAREGVRHPEPTRLPTEALPKPRATPALATGISTFITTCKAWGTQAAQGLREVIDVGGLTAELSNAPRRSHSAQPMATAVGLLERSDGPKIELSMLESLGFYSDSDEVVVSLTDPTPPGIAPSVPAPARRSQVPDLEIGGWRPHVIARSKLGRGRLSALVIVGLSVSLILLVALVASLLQAPAATTARQTSELSETAIGLAAALRRLDGVIEAPSGGVAEASALLLDVDDSARELFDRAAALPEENGPRQAAIGAAQSALALTTALGDALSYRVVLEPLWLSPDLTGVADSTAAAAEIAEWQVGLADVVAELPSSPDLSDHVEQVKGFIAGVENWRIGYLDALTTGDSATAGAAVADLEGQMAILAQNGEEALTTIFATADAERARLIEALAEL